MKEQVLEKRVNRAIAAVGRKSEKTAGTRLGSLDDWREGGANGKSESTEYGKRIRDGR